MHKWNDFLEFEICIGPLGLNLKLIAGASSQNDEWMKFLESKVEP